jgi:alpha-mannosidase
VVDVATGVEVPSQSVVVDGQPRLRILARDVPSVGYRVYEVRAGAGATFPPAASVALPAADNGIYRVALGARGQITSLLDDKDGNRELVDTASGALNDLGLGSGTVTLESSGPVSATLDVAAAGTPPHETRVTLYAGLDRVDVENRITANFGSANQGYASRFDLPGVVMRHEEVGMLARVARAAQGGDYADQNARVDYLTFNHFVDLSQAGRGVTVSNWDAQFFTPGNSTPTVLDTSTPAIRALVGAPVQGPDVGFSGQNGDALFLNRFALRTHGAYDAGDAMRFALEHQNPLVAARLTGGPGGPLPATTWSLLAIDEPDAILWALKPAEEGIDYGLIARVWHVGDQPEAVTLSLPPYGIASAQRTTHVETYVEPANVIGGVLSETLKRQEMATWRLYPNLGPSPVDVGHGGAAELALTAFPNPARADEARFVAYRLPSAGRVRLEVFDLRGARVATLVDGVVEAGSHVARWQADGRRVAPGVYFTRLEAAGKVMRRRVVVLE